MAGLERAGGQEHRVRLTGCGHAGSKRVGREPWGWAELGAGSLDKRFAGGGCSSQTIRQQFGELFPWPELSRLDLLDRLNRAADLLGELFLRQIVCFAAVLECTAE